MLGREFSWDAALRLSGPDEGAAARAMRVLVARELVAAEGAQWTIPGRHVREVAYRGIAAPERRRLHTEAASALPAPHPDLGHHWLGGR